MRLLRDLEDDHWLNNDTRAVLVQFTTFNPTTSLFTISLLAFEYLNIGVVDPYHDIRTWKLYSFTNTGDVFTIILELCYVVLTILYINRAVKSFLSVGANYRKYFANVWTYVDWVIILLSCAPVSVFVLRVITINNAVGTALKFSNSPGNLATFFTQLGTNCNIICFTTVSFYEVSRTPY